MLVGISSVMSNYNHRKIQITFCNATALALCIILINSIVIYSTSIIYDSKTNIAYGQASGEATMDISQPFKPTAKCGDCNTGNNTLSQNGTDAIAKHEGYAGLLKDKCSTEITKNCKAGDDDYGFYNDAAGYCTTGIGHLVAKMSCEEIDRLGENSTIKKTKDKLSWIKSKENATKDFDDKVKEFVDAVNKNVNVCLFQNEFDSLVSFVYNIGEANFKSSTLLKEINNGNFDNIGENLKKWNKIRDDSGKLVESEGLNNRRNAEADAFEGCRETEEGEEGEGDPCGNPNAPIINEQGQLAVGQCR